MVSYNDDYYRDDDRCYEERREYFRQEDLRREDRERDFWKDYDRHDEHAREDRKYERRRQEEDRSRARAEFQRGRTADAIRHLMGPEYALRYLELRDRGFSTASPGASTEPGLSPFSLLNQPSRDPGAKKPMRLHPTSS
jgi:hypothetical protein